MKVKRALTYAAMTGAIILAAACAYYAFVILSARQYTARTILPREKAALYPLAPSSLSARQLEILLKVEDPRFFFHRGVDLSTPGAGLTTITQGLVKRFYFKEFRPGPAKIKQTLIAAYALDPLMSKEEQLRLFINTVYLGQDAYGFEQAARVYFHKPFGRLTEEEFMAMVAMIVAPQTFNVKAYPSRNRERVDRIKRLVSGEYTPRGLCDIYYGPLDQETQKGLAPLSYFKFYYER